MKRTIASAAAILLMAGTAGAAFAKDHKAETGPHAFGQDRADESYVIGGETAAPDAKGVDGEKGIDSDISSAAQSVDRKPADPPKGKPE